MIVVASWMVYRYLAPKTWREWAGAGLVQAFIIALYAEMYGFIRELQDAWLATAAAVPGFIGFAVGRTTFWDPLVAWRDAQTSRDEAVAEVARRYREWVDLFEQARSATSSADIAPRTPPATVQLIGSTL